MKNSQESGGGGYGGKEIKGVKGGTTKSTKVSNPLQRNEANPPAGASADDQSRALTPKQTPMPSS